MHKKRLSAVYALSIALRRIIAKGKFFQSFVSFLLPIFVVGHLSLLFGMEQDELKTIACPENRMREGRIWRTQNLIQIHNSTTPRYQALCARNPKAS